MMANTNIIEHPTRKTDKPYPRIVIGNTLNPCKPCYIFCFPSSHSNYEDNYVTANKFAFNLSIQTSIIIKTLVLTLRCYLNILV